MLNGLLMPAFLFSLLICFLIYLGIGRAEGMKGEEREPSRLAPYPAHLLPEGQEGHGGVQSVHVFTQQCSQAQCQALHVPGQGASHCDHCTEWVERGRHATAFLLWGPTLPGLRGGDPGP